MRRQKKPAREQIAQTRWYLTGWKRYIEGWIFDVPLFIFNSADSTRYYIITGENLPFFSLPYEKMIVPREKAILKCEKEAQTGLIRIKYSEGDRL